jgi:hypothetical protein
LSSAPGAATSSSRSSATRCSIVLAGLAIAAAVFPTTPGQTSVPGGPCRRISIEDRASQPARGAALELRITQMDDAASSAHLDAARRSISQQITVEPASRCVASPRAMPGKESCGCVIGAHQKLLSVAGVLDARTTCNTRVGRFVATASGGPWSTLTTERSQRLRR